MKRFLLFAALLSQPAFAAPTPTKLEKQNGAFRLLRDGKPYFIRGVGGDGPKTLLRDLGGNSFRTWGADNLEAQLDEAQKLGLSVTIGIWLGHTEHGFNYSDEKAVAAQFESAKAAILRLKDHPAVLMWGIGNEMEGFGAQTDPKVWRAVQQIAAFAHQVDKFHPTMTVIAELGGDRVKSVHALCPDIDVVGINSYGGGPSVPKRYIEAGGTKPYVLTEYGPPGVWESQKNSWGAGSEPTSSDKARFYRATYDSAIADQPLSLGGYAFLWGHKQEATATWFGLLLPDNSKLSAADTLSELWGGKPKNRSPLIARLQLDADKLAGGATVRATLQASDPENDALRVEWKLQADPMVQGVGGASEAVPPSFPDAITQSDTRGATLKMPAFGGAYRLFAFVYDAQGNAAVGNVPLFVEGNTPMPLENAPRATLPLQIVGDNANANYAASGYMGNHGATKMDAWTQNPHSGKTCLRVSYAATDSWAGVTWQSPANDWGDLPGGFDLSGAKTLSFWARGETGGETVTFKFGILGRDKKYGDSSGGEKADIKLSREWTRYAIDVQGQDLSRVKTPFVWTLAGQGKPVTFYVDDVAWE